MVKIAVLLHLLKHVYGRRRSRACLQMVDAMKLSSDDIDSVKALKKILKHWICTILASIFASLHVDIIEQINNNV